MGSGGAGWGQDFVWKLANLFPTYILCSFRFSPVANKLITNNYWYVVSSEARTYLSPRHVHASTRSRSISTTTGCIKTEGLVWRHSVSRELYGGRCTTASGHCGLAGRAHSGISSPSCGSPVWSASSLGHCFSLGGTLVGWVSDFVAKTVKVYSSKISKKPKHTNSIFGDSNDHSFCRTRYWRQTSSRK